MTGWTADESSLVTSVDDLLALPIEFPMWVRPAYVLDYGSIAYSKQELHELVAEGIGLSPTGEVRVRPIARGKGKWKDGGPEGA